MHSFLLSLVLNFSVAIPAVAGVIRFKQVIKRFYPFLFLVWLGLFNESLSLAMIYTTGGNAVNGNLYVFIEFLLILWQFYRWNTRRLAIYIVAIVLGSMVWITDNFILNSITQNNSLFRAFYSFVILLFSIDQISKLTVFVSGNLLKNAIFIICIAFVFYYGCKTFVEMNNALHVGLPPHILADFWTTMSFVNALSNIFYAIAILCIPTREEFIFPY